MIFVVKLDLCFETGTVTGMCDYGVVNNIRLHATGTVLITIWKLHYSSVMSGLYEFYFMRNLFKQITQPNICLRIYWIRCALQTGFTNFTELHNILKIPCVVLF